MDAHPDSTSNTQISEEQKMVVWRSVKGPTAVAPAHASMIPADGQGGSTGSSAGGSSALQWSAQKSLSGS